MPKAFQPHRVALILSIQQTKPDIYANSVDPDEMAHNEPSNQDLDCVPL